MRIVRVPTAGVPRPKLDRLTRNRPRAFAEWYALRRWGKLPPWELEVVGYRLRAVREAAGLTQEDLAERLGVTQQAVAQAERWQANPTVDLLRRWAAACGTRVEIRLGKVPRTRLSRFPAARAASSTSATAPRGRTRSRTAN